MKPSAPAWLPVAAGPWAGPVLFSVAVHLSLIAGYVLLGDSDTPPRPPAVLAIDVVTMRDVPGAGETRPAEPAVSAASAPAAPRETPQSGTAPREPGETLKTDRKAPETAARRSEPPPAERPEIAPTAQAMPAAAEIPEPVPAPLKPALERATVQPAAHAPLPKRKPALAPPPIGMAEKAAASRAPVSFAPRPPDRQGNPDTDARPTNAAPSEIASAAAAGAATARPVPPRYAAPGRGNPMPVYPPSARRRGIEGRLVLRVRVDTRGRAATIDIVASSGHGLLDAAAERAVRKWNFTPARRAGIPVSATLDVPVVFRLRD